MATFVQEGQILHISLENNPKKYVFQFFLTDRPTGDDSNQEIRTDRLH